MSQTNLRTSTDESPFVELLGTESRVRILDVLLRKPHMTLTRAEIAELAGVDPTTFDRNKPILERLGCLSTTKDRGQTEYSLNIEHPVVKRLGSARAELLEYMEEVHHDKDQIGEEELKTLLTQEAEGSTNSNKESRSQVTKALAESRALEG